MTNKGAGSGLPCCPVVKNLPCNAGDSGMIPGQGTQVPRAAEQLSPHTTTRASVGRNERSHVLQLRPDTAEEKNIKKKKAGSARRGLIKVRMAVSHRAEIGTYICLPRSPPQPEVFRTQCGDRPSPPGGNGEALVSCSTIQDPPRTGVPRLQLSALPRSGQWFPDILSPGFGRGTRYL